MIFQIITVLSGFYIGFIIYRKNFEYIGNKMFIISFIIFALYAFVLFLYEFPLSVLINEVLLNLSLYMIVVGVLFFVLSMQVFTQGSMFLKKITTKILILISIIAWIIVLFFPYKVIQVTPEVKANKDYVSLLTTGILAISFMIYNLVRIIIALNEIDRSETRIRKKITILGIAQLIGLLSPLMSVIGNVTKNDVIHGLMFIFLAIPMVIVGILISKGREQ